MAAKEIYDLEELFADVQLNSILEDGKTFVDSVPKYSLEEIQERYLAEKGSATFNLEHFVADNFILPPAQPINYTSDPAASVEEHIRSLWNVLTRMPSKENSSLLNLPHIYIVPGGRFREIYYWDSYFTMLGLKVHGRVDLIENMIGNFAYLIRTYGHIPNGNRQYYLSRSQPPFFALMVSLLADIKKDDGVYTNYYNELLQEYTYWQNGNDTTRPGTATEHVVQLEDGEWMNRFFDNNPKPRQESYAEDVHLANVSGQAPEQLFANLRAGAESGWDFSSRWFADGKSFATIRTTDIIPVDLNSLIYTLELTIAKAAGIGSENEKLFLEKAAARKQAILKYCWNESVGFYCDYNFVTQQQNTNITAAGLYPLFVKIADTTQAKLVADKTATELMRDGGLVTTPVNSGQQWDAPNGWAPLQWTAYMGLKNYGHNQLADQLAKCWLRLNEKVFKETGKLMEKYNVEDLDQPAGGGEYPGQDGFGWTNGIYMAMKEQLGEIFAK